MSDMDIVLAEWHAYRDVIAEKLKEETDPKKRGDIVQTLVRDLKGIGFGDYWTHYKGGVYLIVGLAVKEDTLEPVVMYQSLRYNTFWVRTLDNFLQMVTLDDGTQVHRFKKGSP